MKAIITIRKDKKNKFGQCPIVIQLNEGKTVARIPLGENIEPQFFNAELQMISTDCHRHKALNELLFITKKKIKNTFRLFNPLVGDSGITELKIEPKDYCQVYKEIFVSSTPELEVENIKRRYSLVLEERTETVQIVELSRIKLDRRVPRSKYVEINQLIDKYLAGVRDEQIQQILERPEFDETDEEYNLFMSAWDSYYKYCSLEKKESTFSRIPNNRKILIDFCKKYNQPLTFEGMTEDFGREFKYYLVNEHVNIYTKEKGVSNGTVHNIQKSICAFLNWSFKKGLNKSLEFKKWDTRKPKSDQHYLREHELKQLINPSVLITPSEEKVKDLFLFSAYTGMRYSDVVKFNKALINNGMIKYVAEKTGKRCVVKLLPVTEQILEKYNYQLPVKVGNYNEKIKSVLRKIGITQEVTRTLQKGKQNISKVKPLSDFITFHSARRSFINLMISKGVQVAHLSTMVGNDVPSLMIYYKSDTTQIDKVMSELQL